MKIKDKKLETTYLCDNNVCCPFCGEKIKDKIPEGLELKKIAEFIGKLTLAEQRLKES